MQNTIYIPTFLSPRNSTIDSSVSNTFSAQINGLQITDYQIKVYKISDNTTVYDSTKVNLNQLLYDREILTHELPANSIANGLDLKWTLTVWNEIEQITTGEVFFRTRTTPQLQLFVPPTIIARRYEFAVTYTQAENVPVKKYKFILANQKNDVIYDSGFLFGGNMKHLFDGFENNSVYKVKCVAENQVGVIVDTGFIEFQVSYPQPSLIVKPDLVLLPDKSAIEILWSQAKQIEGVVDGEYSFLDNFLIPSNVGININSNSSLNFETDIPDVFTLTFVVQFSQNFTGVFCRLDENYEIGYANGKFYYQNGEAYEEILEIPINGNQFLVCVRPNNVYIRPLNLVGIWNDYKENLWNELEDKTWNDLLYIYQSESNGGEEE